MRVPSLVVGIFSEFGNGGGLTRALSGKDVREKALLI
jgi:hypothetical protein